MRDFTGPGVFKVETAANNRQKQKPGSFGYLNERKSMKNVNIMVMVAATAAMFTLTTSAKAQAVGDDGIAASPKLRQFLNERKTVASAPSTGVASVGYSEPGKDGIAASPKLRQQLNERGAHVMIAPLK